MQVKTSQFGLSASSLRGRPTARGVRAVIRILLMHKAIQSSIRAVSVCWSGPARLPWLELDWFMDVSSRIAHLDLSSQQPWGSALRGCPGASSACRL
ncbi:hypothetical protein KUCAC02_002107 [Chaenocephalus aceratus]|uniref:Uncharacterized protein n=1 Tax=Chaenocephalus aceratus TaxID=36190 RepID=A0ACB9XTS7_CHAAC|nr:hypothetical protein KUCAC02_002107 [Chaenocephalus aceratus]